MILIPVWVSSFKINLLLTWFPSIKHGISYVKILKNFILLYILSLLTTLNTKIILCKLFLEWLSFLVFIQIVLTWTLFLLFVEVFATFWFFTLFLLLLLRIFAIFMVRGWRWRWGWRSRRRSWTLIIRLIFR